MNEVKKSKVELLIDKIIIEESTTPKSIEEIEIKSGIDTISDIKKSFIQKKTVSKAKVEVREISKFDEFLFHEGSHVGCYSFMGAHFASENRKRGVRFTTWAPNASSIHVVGSFSNWEIKDEYRLNRFNNNGLWTIFIPGLKEGMEYKFAILTNGNTVYKADPYAFKSEFRPNTASILTTEPKYRWTDKKWINKRAKAKIESLPVNTYELQLASWKTKDGTFMTYDELSDILPAYIKDMGYTHVELMPLTEYPLDASWGYQATGYYSPTARHGDAIGLKKLINSLHKEDIGVILDWVPGHFCKDQHGLYMFDGTPTYEYTAWWKADNKGWGTCNFDLGRSEVKSFLISNAAYWIKEFHIDGLRVDAVSNMLYLNYGREEGEWEPNCFGDCGNLEGIQFLKEFNSRIKDTFPGVITIAEESTAWPNITAPIENNGLGFSFKWNMGWMNDTLRYVKLDPIYRKYNHNLINFSMMYNYSEKFVLPISHDEVVHGKGSLINKMWGDNWNKYSGLRLYSAFMMAHPGKKLLFMGSEFGQFIEWREYEELQWHIIDEYDIHKKTQDYFKTLNKFYLENKALWQLDYDPDGFQWIDADNSEKSILSFIRKSDNEKDTLIYICNFTPVVYYDFNIGVPLLGEYKEVFNTDALEFGGTGQIIGESLWSTNGSYNNQPYTLTIKVPPMAVTVLKYV